MSSSSKGLSILRHKSSLNRIFFTHDAPIAPYTEEYDNFWKFLEKYEQKVRSSDQKSNVSVDTRTPKVECWDKPAKELMHRIVIDQDERDCITKKHVEITRDALHTYMLFLKNQEEKKRQKLAHFQNGLPIAQYKEHILDTLNEHQVLLIAGDTGCGKSTQVPRYLLEAGYEGIVVTQPRRIAAISLASRVSYEKGCDLGSTVGYQIRFERKSSKDTKLTFMTEGLLLRLLSSPETLETYSVIILDEIHERHISCDFLLGLLKCVLLQKSNLKLVLMSATANLKLFSNYFNNCPVVEVPGRLYPVEVMYIPPEPSLSREGFKKRSKIDPAPYLKVLNLIEQTVPKNERGDVLVFLSGVQEITALQEEIEGREGWIVLLLHSSLPTKQQDKVFLNAPEGMRKCILSTNIAETSVTIDGVRFVVDSGKVKEMAYDASCRMQRLKEFWSSKASARQRKGRAGRTGPGKCFRLYTEKQFEEMEEYSEPEIRKVPLHTLIIQLAQLGLANVREFPFLESPDLDSIEHSIITLIQQGALTPDESLTSMGKLLAQLPVDLSVGKVLILGCLFQELLEASLTLAATLSVPSPLTLQSFRCYDTVRKRQELEDRKGDPLTIMRVYHEWLQIKLEDHESSYKWCKRHGIEEQRLYEITKLRAQFLRILKDVKLYDIPEVELSSSERIRRHGEVHQLRNLRKEAEVAEKKSRKRKLDSYQDDNDEDDDQMDVKHIDFRLAQNEKTMRRLLRKSSNLSHSEKSILLWILTAGLYPQVALSDTHNSYKKDSDQLFHTSAKGFVTLHPNSVLALNPDVLRLDDSDIQSIQQGFSVSSKHQILAYMSLLETTKPYLVNCVRLPTLHFLMMLAGQIHTSPCLKRLVFDSTFEIRIYGTSEECHPSKFMLKVILARLMFQKCFQKMLQESDSEDSEGQSSASRRLSRQLFKHLGHVLVKFENIFYTQKRLLPADLKTMFVNEPLKLCNFLCLGSLESFESAEDEPKCFKCPQCEENHSTFSSCVQHLELCVLNEESKQTATASEVSENKSDGYFCKHCQQHIGTDSNFEILKHVKKCREGPLPKSELTNIEAIKNEPIKNEKIKNEPMKSEQIKGEPVKKELTKK